MSSSFSDLKLVFQCSIFLGMFVPSELCEVLETDEAGAEDSGPVKYQCLDCLALFDSSLKAQVSRFSRFNLAATVCSKTL
jgi:hypothetical protein